MHHVDGNHNNNNPYNLALVYGPDHARMHANGLVFTNPQKSWTFGGYFILWLALLAGLCFILGGM